MGESNGNACKEKMLAGARICTEHCCQTSAGCQLPVCNGLCGLQRETSIGLERCRYSKARHSLAGCVAVISEGDLVSSEDVENRACRRRWAAASVNGLWQHSRLLQTCQQSTKLLQIVVEYC